MKSFATFSMLLKQQQLLLIMVLVLFFLCNSVDADDVDVTYQFKGKAINPEAMPLSAGYLYGHCIPSVYSKRPVDTIVARTQAVCFVYQNAGCKGPVLDQRLNLNIGAARYDLNIIKKGQSFVCIQTGKQENPQYDPEDD
ncbi:hypothetical protein BCR42DRAFT_426461 [Absidia repens]|uniref:Uncharacterized protein n=1 Tax=Absidia repens TaxID=90262 RepID=A0A1X2I1A7_9FUNG|nr:hypothetical protein BCR42DRAFT_426461 [Absidia repens]